MKKIVILVPCLLLLTTIIKAQTEEKQRGIAVRPVTLDFTVSPGNMETNRVLITNGLEVKKQFIVYVADWRRDTIGSHVYSEPGNDPRSCASWIDLDKTFFELEPGQTEELTVKLTNPADSLKVNQMRWCMLFVETTQEKEVKDTSGFTTTIASRFRVGIHIYQTPKGITEKEIRLLTLEPLDRETNKYRITCENTGATQLHCTSYLELASLNDGSRTRIPAIEFPIFPEQKRFLDFEIPASMTKGKYTLTGIIDAGEDVPLEAAQLTIEIK